MLAKFNKIVLPLAGLIVAGLILLGQWIASQANRSIDEANAAIQEANKQTEEAAEKYKQLYAEANLQGFPGNREQFKELAQQAADGFGRSAEQFRTAAAKFEEAAARPVADVVIEYWKLKMQSTRKLADAKDAYRSMALLWLDPKCDSLEKLTAALDPLVKTAEQRNQESGDFDAQAEKLQKENPNKIK